MQYSKHKWVITRPLHTMDYVPILHAELSLYLILAILFIVFLQSRWLTYLVLTLYYVMSLIDFVTWLTTSRPFHPADIARAIDLMAYYPAFFSVDRTLATRTTLLALAPLFVGLAVWLLHRRSVLAPSTLRVSSSRTVVPFCFVYIVMLPFVASPRYLRYNSVIRRGQELAYEYELRHTRTSDIDQLRFFGNP